jgi:tetratricopeptide (TPR) repeat protein
MRSFLSVLVICCAVLPALGQDVAPDATTVLAQAERAFESGQAMLRSDPAAARQHYARSALLFEQLINEFGYDNADAHYNEGNALLLSGQPGRALAAYLRASRLRPHDDDIAAGLAVARAQTSMHVPESTGARVAEVLTIWRGVIPRSVMLWGALLGWLALWAGAGVRLMGSRRPSAGVLIGAAMLCVVTSGALILEQQLLYAQPIGVVVVDYTQGYNGPDVNAYEPTFTAPLGEGVECEILEERGDWFRVKLRNGQKTWVRQREIELV